MAADGGPGGDSIVTGHHLVKLEAEELRYPLLWRQQTPGRPRADRTRATNKI